MAFQGLFIGVDRYASPSIKELTCAARDATALEALFADTLGGRTTLLTDAAATRGRIEAEFLELAKCSPEDTVVIAFSGHGSDTHELVTYDTDVRDLKATAVPLDLLQEWFSKVPARRLIFFLDCCFSGGMGAKVFNVGVHSRDLTSVEARLAELAGAGRIIFTASSATEPAYEDSRFGHGFLTYFLLEALRGANEVVSSGKISLYRLLEHVTARVKSAAGQISRPQNPTMRGTIDGELMWPVFVPGEKYRAAFPDRVAVPVTADLASLRSHGFPAALVSAWSGAIPSLNVLQTTAINDCGLLDGKHLLVSAPTSSGKTLLGELAALKHVLTRKRALFLLPLKALVADKRRHFEAIYGSFGVRTIEATGETDDIGPLLRGQYDIALLTYEKFAAIALTFPHVLAQAGVVVVDEVQMVADPGRGANLEFLLTLIRMRRREGIEPQLIALSAVIGDTNGFESWLGGRLLLRTERPVPLDEGLLLADGTFQLVSGTTGKDEKRGPIIQRAFGKGTSQDLIIPLVRKLVAEGQQVIVFRETKGEARGCAIYLAAALGLPAAGDALARLHVGDPSQANVDLRTALRGGVAFHISDLDREERRVVEEEFRRAPTTLRVIAATTTLAMGVNTPASSVVIAGLQHPGDVPYSVAEYKNLVGRAGRLGYAESGTSYLLALDPLAQHDLWSRYVKGQPEAITSRFLTEETDARSLIVRVLVASQRTAGRGVSTSDIVTFLEGSFGAFQAARRREGWRWSQSDLMSALADLERHDLIERDPDTNYRLTALGRLAGETATEVRSIIALVDCLRPLQPGHISDPALIAAAQTTAEVDQLYFPMNKRSTDKEPRAWWGELHSQSIPDPVLSAMRRNVDATNATLRAKKAVACLLFVSGRPMAEIERILTQFGGRSDGAAGPIRSVAARTCDLLPATARVAQLLHPDLDLDSRAAKLVARLTYGIPGDAVDLARECGDRLLRSDYCSLHRAGFCEPDAIAKAPDEPVLECIGGDKVKLALVRRAGINIARRRQEAASIAAGPALEPYTA